MLLPERNSYFAMFGEFNVCFVSFSSLEVKLGDVKWCELLS